MMRAKTAALLFVSMSLAGCAQVPWTPRYVAAPVKRHHASEERAVQALDEYFNAAKDLVGLSQARIHDRCLDAYWGQGSSGRTDARAAGPDQVCSLVLKRFDEAAQNIAGYGQSPSGKYPWLGEVFEYVLRTQTVKTKEEKMAGLDHYTIKKFEDLMSGPPSPVIPRVAKDYYVIRGTCCRDVTVFDDWYKARFDRVASK